MAKFIDHVGIEIMKKVEKFNQEQRVSKILQDPCFEDFTWIQISNALCDGEFLATKNWAQIDVESTYEEVCDIVYCKANDC